MSSRPLRVFVAVLMLLVPAFPAGAATGILDETPPPLSPTSWLSQGPVAVWLAAALDRFTAAHGADTDGDDTDDDDEDDDDTDDDDLDPGLGQGAGQGDPNG